MCFGGFIAGFLGLGFLCTGVVQFSRLWLGFGFGLGVFGRLWVVWVFRFGVGVWWFDCGAPYCGVPGFGYSMWGWYNITSTGFWLGFVAVLGAVWFAVLGGFVGFWYLGYLV